MTNDLEPRALGAALAAPTFVTRGHRIAAQAANRHVERFAPEANAGRVRSMHSLGFVDRLVAPWIETAQRSASLRMFSGVATAGLGDREARPVSWVFPRPWYQDELDWMTAARHVTTQTAHQPPSASPTLLTTRGTFVAPAQGAAGSPIHAPPVAMPSALYEYIAPSLSLTAAGQPGALRAGAGRATGSAVDRGAPSREAYSPLISLAAVQAAELMSRAVGPLAIQRGAPGSAATVSPGLRSVLSAILERAASSREQPASRLSQFAPELVTPPAPRPELSPEAVAAGATEAGASAAFAGGPPVAAGSASADAAARVARQMAEQRVRITELQRIALQSAQREAAARAEAAARSAAAAEPAGQAAPAARSTAAGAGAPGDATSAQRAEAAARVAAAAEAARAAQGQAASAAELRATAQRTEAELRERAVASRTAEAQRQADAAGATERAGGQRRLHEQARSAAAAHARAAADQALPSAAPARAAGPPGSLAPGASAPSAPSAEVAAAIASLPPELAAIVGSAVQSGQQPAAQALSRVNEALRTVELLARSSAAGAAFEATRGPRLVMPAGLGALVSAVDRAQVIADRPALLGGGFPVAPQPSLVEPPRRAAPIRREVRVPALPWLVPAARQAAAPTTALGATEASAPAALSHVAWADRWLARFAGAAPQSLDTLSAASSASPELRRQALASAAPGAVFVVPDFARGDLGAESASWISQTRARGLAAQRVPESAEVAAQAYAQASARAEDARAQTQARAEAEARGQAEAHARAEARARREARGLLDAQGRPIATPAGAAPAGARPGRAGEPVLRFDDAAETPDEVFAAISAAAARGRGAAVRPAVTPSAGPAAGQVAQAAARSSLADMVAHAAPAAPGAGLSAQLASSPFAPALRHVVPLPSAASFDVRSLFGAGLGATYLAGLIGAASRELEIGAQATPRWASWTEAPMGQLGQLAGRGGPGDLVAGVPGAERAVPGFEAAYVSPALPVSDGDGSPAAAYPSDVLAAAASEAAQRAAAGPAGSIAQGAPTGAATPGAFAPGDAELAAHAASVAAAAASGAPGARTARALTASAMPDGDRGVAPLTTLRSALLSFDAPAAGGSWGDALSPAALASLVAVAGSTGSALHERSSIAARRMIEGMSLPMLGDAADPSAAWGSPGMVADRAHAWSVAQERSSADLAFDFVTPELVLAARVYGLGPAEAAQAARLAVVGPGQLGAMAGAVDRTFVESMAIEREARSFEAERVRAARNAMASNVALGAAPGAGDASLGATGAAPGQPADAAAAPRAQDAAQRAPAGVAGDLVRPSDSRAAGSSSPSLAQTGDALRDADLARPVTQDERHAMRTTADGEAGAGGRGAAAALSGAGMPPPSESLFGVARRAPRGAFLWPSAAVAALGMSALGSDGQLSMSVAALELLAAQVVAELGTYTALSDAQAVSRAAGGAGAAGADGFAGELTNLSDQLDAGAASARGGAAAGRSAGDALSSGGQAGTQLDAQAARDAGRDGAAGSAAARPTLGGGWLAARASGRDAFVAGTPGEPGEADVLGAAAAFVPASRRERFNALYVALNDSPAGRGLSPAARAARALALVSRSDGGPLSARERAAAAWDVLPVVYPSGPGGPGGPGGHGATSARGAAGGDADADVEAGGSPAAASAAALMASFVAPSMPGGGGFGPGGFGPGSFGPGSFGPGGLGGAAGRRGAAQRGVGPRDLVSPDAGRDAGRDAADIDVTSPGLAGLSARAGAALSAYVTPVAAPSAPSQRASDSSSAGAVLRPPTAAPEYVQTGRSAGRYGGGEVEIPPWFEAAARRMLADRAGNTDGISLAELTLVTAAPASHIAASTQSQPRAAPPSPSGAKSAGPSNHPQIDVDKVANEVYRKIMTMMDAARSRNGEPHL